MAYVPIEKLIHKDESLYKLVLASAARANELAQGAQPFIQTSSKKVSTVALEEIAGGKVKYEHLKKAHSKKTKE